MTILFLDFDGVLHPSEVYKYHGRGIVLEAGPEHQLFEHADLLATLLEPFPEVNIVLSTSWCSSLRRFDEVKARLPKALQARVAGSTWHSAKEQYRWGSLTRYEQIAEYVSRHQIINWLAIDDDDERWPESGRDSLVHTDHWLGIGVVSTQQELQAKLLRLRETGGEREGRPIRLLHSSCW